MNNSPFMKKVRDTLRFKQMDLSTEKNYQEIGVRSRFEAYRTNIT